MQSPNISSHVKYADDNSNKPANFTRRGVTERQKQIHNAVVMMVLGAGLTLFFVIIGAALIIAVAASGVK